MAVEGRTGPEWRSKVRGLLLGLAVGDTVGAARGSVPATQSLRSGVSTQLAAFTTEGLIRASVRFNHRGICHPPSVIWHAYARWAALQGIDMPGMHGMWDGGSTSWPDGWLADVAVLRQRRGSAPATVKALRSNHQGSTDHPVGTSRGAHALTRTLPVAALMHNTEDPTGTVKVAQDIAALTHGDPIAPDATGIGVAITAYCLRCPSFSDAVDMAFTNVPSSQGLGMAIDQAQHAGAKLPGEREWLRDLAPDATVTSALRGAIYTAMSFPRPDQFLDALQFACAAPAGGSVAVVTGAFLGAHHGANSLPVDLLSRHELAWVLDVLAGDLVQELTDSPGGTEYSAARDPSWLRRYPGW